MPVPSSTLAIRLECLRESLAESKLDALAVTHLPNIQYLTNFRGSAAALVITPDRLQLVTDFRYRHTVEHLLASAEGPPGADLVLVEHSYDETIAASLRPLGPVRIGVEAAHLALRRYNWLASRLIEERGTSPGTCPALVPTDRLVERLRLVKDAHEVATLRRAAARLCAVAREAFRQVRAGRRERDIAGDIDATIRRAGFERPAFDTIVASGPNSAFPHARAGERVLEPGDAVLLDFGGVYDGYCVDLTRTVSVGRPPASLDSLHVAVAQAHAAALAAIRPGARPGAVDAAARGTLDRLGLGDAFGHSTGHGLGLEVHEEPRIARERGSHGDEDVPSTLLEPGMVFTVEPGVYVPGLGGVRIEDDVVVTVEGCDVLTDLPTDLLVI
jgi:Xaa-Pro aminopeptidase